MDNEIRATLEAYKLAAQIAAREMKVSSNSKIKEKITELVRYVGYSSNIENYDKYSKSNNSLKQQIGRLIQKNEKHIYPYSDSYQYDLVNEIEQGLRKAGYNYDVVNKISNKINRICGSIRNNPAQAIGEAIDGLQSEYYNYVATEKAKNDRAKADAQKKQARLEEQRGIADAKRQAEYLKEHGYTKEQVDQILNEYINGERYSVTYEEKNAMAKAYPGIYGYMLDDLFTNLHNCVEAEKLLGANASKTSSTELLNLVISFGQSIYNNLPKELLRDYNSLQPDTRNFLKRFKVDQSLQVYEKLVDALNKKYSKASDEEKAKLDKAFASRSNLYFEYFKLRKPSDGNTIKGILNVDELKDAVNKSVMKEITGKISVASILKDDGSVISKLTNATKYMDESQIKTIYHNIRENYLSYSESIPAEQQEFASKFQRQIAAVIMNRINLDVSNKAKSQQEREMYMVSICREILKEEPKFEVSIDKKQPLGVSAEKRIKGDTTMREASMRFYGMDKLQQTFNLVNQKKLRNLQEQHRELTEEEQEQVSGMFRK